MSFFSFPKPTPLSDATETGAGAPVVQPAGPHPLDAVTGGAFSAATSGERAARIREWLATDPSAEAMNDVFKELSQRDRGASKVLKEKLDEIKRQKGQAQLATDWAQKAEALLAHSRLNLADALAWQRDAAKAGAPLSREPLQQLKAALGDRVKAIEDLQHRVQVEREAAVLLAQRIEVLSTKPWRDAEQHTPGLKVDVQQWQDHAAQLALDPQWLSVEPKFPPMLDSSRAQLRLVWEAFEAALATAVAAHADAHAPLPAVPVWADELRLARGLPLAASQERQAQDAAAFQEKRAKASAELERALAVLEQELAQGHGKATPKAAAEVRGALKAHARVIAPELETRAHAALTQAGDLEDWQRWRADQLREELVKKAEALVQVPDGQRMGGRKMQDTLRALREQWKASDQGGQANHALWKRFDEACNEAHKVVETWLSEVRLLADAHKAQRLAIIDELKAWTEAHAEHTDWKQQVRELHGFSERWREAGHLSEKAFADIQPVWKAAMQAAHAGLERVQGQSIERRRALIDEAQALSASAQWRIDEVKSLQQRWQAEAHSVPLERKQEQKLWDAFRQPIDEVFARKSREREQATASLNAHDQRVLDATQVVEQACASGDAQQIRAAVAALEAALRGQAEPVPSQPVVEKKAATSDPVPVTEPVVESAVAEPSVEEGGAPAASELEAPPPAEEAKPAAPPPAPPKKVVAVRGDDRPGMKKTEPAGRDAKRGPGRPDARGAGRADVRGPGRPDARGERPAPGRGDGSFSRERDAPAAMPRLGDAAFRAQRQAYEHADAAMRRLHEAAHGEVLTQIMHAWAQRDAAALPAASALGARVGAGARQAWAQQLERAAASDAAGDTAADALLRLEMAAELPTPAEHLSARRMLQLQLLTRRNDRPPADTWPEDVARVLATAHEAAAAKRLQSVLKAMLKR